MFKVAVVDDNKLTLDLLETLLSDYLGIITTYTYTDPHIALEEIMKEKADLVFLDINMPKMNGLELASKLMEHDESIKVVFITAYNYYAIEAFELYALDYLLKPINKERLAKTMKRFLALKEPITPKQVNDVLYIKTFGGLEVYNSHKPVNWKGPKTEELFAFLISHYEKGIHKELIIEHLWHDYDYNRALSNMQTALYRVRQALNDMGDYIQIKFSCDNYYVEFKSIHFDLLEFTNLLEKIDVVNERTIALAEHAIHLYKGEYLEKNAYLWSYGKQAYLQSCFENLFVETMKYKTENHSELYTFLRNIKRKGIR